MVKHALNPPIGLFGGSFDPPHSGHWHVAETARKRLGLSEVIWCVARGNPLKSPPADYIGRVEKVESLIAGSYGHCVSTIEADLGITYAIDTIAAMQTANAKTPFVWIMGGDSLSGFHQWRYWQEFANTIPICVISRPDETMSALNSPFVRRYSQARIRARNAKLLPYSASPAWTYLAAPFSYESSTAIRKGLR